VFQISFSLRGHRFTMSDTNQSSIKEFIIVGFPGLQPQYHSLVALVFFLVYVTILIGNILTTALLFLERSLQKPMYYIILNLALSDICFSTVTLPKIIVRYWFQLKSISFVGCFVQKQLVHYFGTLNSFIMMLMALDRYVAICFPLRYHMLISNRTILILSCMLWLISWIFPTVTTIHQLALSYCGPNTINHCYCDSISITNLACDDRTFSTVVSFVLAMLVLLVPLSFTIFSYGHIIISVLRIASTQGRYKTFSTCSTQLCIISLYYIPRCTVYTANLLLVIISADWRILTILLYSLLPAMVNPLIYFFRTKEIKQSLMKRFRGEKIAVQTEKI
uniref:Olfactory receptor n=1 Tax=Lepisosteus oculatus TaxID=7918 RepID=W5NM99_LEPOC